jgi:LAO/AO transport system kinase
MTLPSSAPIDIKALSNDLRAGSRAALARAITLIESRRADHQAAARDLVQALLPDTGTAIRVGITGSPGVGKSTTIDVLGMFLIERGLAGFGHARRRCREDPRGDAVVRGRGL